MHAIPAGFSRAWAMSIALVLLTWAAIVALLFPSAASMVQIWDSSETYAHGYVILPLALWLIWRKRHEALATPTAPDVKAIPVVAMLCLVWVASRVAGIQVGEHFALVSLLIAALWMLLGWRLFWVLFFPFSYLLFMVPSGAELTEPLINFTADFTVFVLRLLGFPVYREGTYFSIPSGDWSVVEACSGLRYFLSSLVLGSLYAYLTYKTWWKRLAFGIASIVVPILANGFRAVIIVLIGHYSGMTLAVGIDHLIYGWVWFGIVMLFLFWVGNFWREDRIDGQRAETAATPASPVVLPRPAWFMALLLVSLVAAFPTYERQISSRPPVPSPLEHVTVPTGWQPTDKPVTQWKPRWQGPDDERTLHLMNGDKAVMVYIGWYGTQRQDRELISSQNVLAPEKDDPWRKTMESGKTVALAANTHLAIKEALVDSPIHGQRLLVWHWNRIAGHNSTGSVDGKLAIAWRKLTGRSDAGTVIILATPYMEKPSEAEPILTEAARELLPKLYPTLDEDMK